MTHKIIKLTHMPDAFVEARERDNQDWVLALPIRSMAQWLAAMGYRYVSGSNGLWQKEYL